MAGGSGERFWPLSRRNKPKQLLSLVSEKTMLEESVLRIREIIHPEDVFVITSELLLEPIRRAVKLLPPENIVAEPAKRNTAPCLALAASFIAAKYQANYDLNEISMAVLTADQDIAPVSDFCNTVEAVLSFVEKNDYLGTIGIRPTRPETGYGYIETGEIRETVSEIAISAISRFCEKPDLNTAEEFLQSGKFLWNSGMFFWRLDTFIQAMSKHLPEVGKEIDYMIEAYKGKTNAELSESLNTVSETYCNFPNVSIDFGLMEKAEKIAVAEATFHWDDIGSWDSLERFAKKDANGNILLGTNVLTDSSGSVVYNATKQKEVIVSGISLKNMVVVVTDDAVLVCPKDKVQDVKKNVEIMKNSKLSKWL